MRKSLLTIFKSLLLTAFVAGAIWSCEDEKPEIIIPDPDPITPQREFVYLESLTPDTVKFAKFRELDSVTFNFRTIPYDLLRRDSLTIQIADSAGAKYQFADIHSLKLRADSIWNIVTYIKKGVRSGDAISVMVSSKDTVMYSDPIVLYLIPREPRAIESLSPDTITFKEGDSAVICFKTLPLDLLARDSVKIAITDTTGADYDFAYIKSATLQDSIWNIVTRMTYGMKSGDIVKIRILDEDTVMYTRPVVLKMIPKPIPIHYSLDIVSDKVSAFLEGGQPSLRIRTAPWNILFNDTTFVLSLTDPQGKALDNILDIDSKEFQPQDSCWSIKIKILDKTLADAQVSAHMVCPDTVMTSSPINVKKVSINMKSIMVNDNLSMRYDSASNTYTCRVAPTADFSSQKFRFEHDGDYVTLGDSLLPAGQSHVLNLKKPVTISVWKYDVHVEYTLKLLYDYAISVISDQVSAFLEGGQATIRLKTAPWNVLPSDGSFVLALADTAGNAIDQKVKIASKMFNSADSSWTVSLDIPDQALTDAFVTAKLTCPDTVVYSSVVNVKKVSFALTSVIWNDNIPLKYDSNNRMFSYNVDSLTQTTGQKIKFDHDGDRIMLGNQVLEKGQNYTLDLAKPITVSVWKYDIHIDYKISLFYYVVDIISGSVSAFLDGGQATIRVRTKPWDVLQDKVNYSLALTDLDGNAIRTKLGIASKEFQETDSSWTVKVKILNSNVKDENIRVKLTCPDTVMLSKSSVNIKKVTISMTSVNTKIDNNTYKLNYSSELNTFHLFKPNLTINYTNQSFLFTHDGDQVTFNGQVLPEGQYNTLDVSQPVTVSVWKYDVYKDFTIRLNTGLPIVRIDNAKSMNSYDRANWVGGATMRVELPDGTIDYEGTLSLKGRGNGTWTETNKKPFALKLDEKSEHKILGMHKQKRWILLANYKDRTLLRNDAAFWLSRNTEMPYTVEGRFVELVWNGKHMGTYYLCEQARIDNHRIDITNPKLDNPAEGGYFMEIDAFLDYNNNGQNGSDKVGDVGFWSTGGYVTNGKGRYNLPYIFKDPDEDEQGNPITKDSPAFKYMQNYVKEMEDAIYAVRNDHNNHSWMNYLDIDRAVDFALIQEITMNHDSYNTWPVAGPHSAFLYKDSCGPICFGPTWDFDYHTFTLYNDYSNGRSWSSSENSRLRQWEILKMDNKGSNNKYYFADLAKNDAQFRARLLERWDQYKNTWKTGLPAYIDEMAQYILISEYYNRQLYGSNAGSVNSNNNNYKQNGDWDLSFLDAVKAMKTAFQKRWEWMDSNLKTLGN